MCKFRICFTKNFPNLSLCDLSVTKIFIGYQFEGSEGENGATPPYTNGDHNPTPVWNDRKFQYHVQTWTEGLVLGAQDFHSVYDVKGEQSRKSSNGGNGGCGGMGGRSGNVDLIGLNQKPHVSFRTDTGKTEFFANVFKLAYKKQHS